MKRAAAQKAVDAAFLDTLGGEYKNILIGGLFADRPDRQGTETAFRKSLAINLAAHKVASRAVAEISDLED